MADNLLYIPHLNPVKFFDVSRANLDKYFTKHFDDWMFSERQYPWQQREDYVQVWQIDDIINLQFESMFDPIIVTVVDSDGNVVLTLPTLVGLPHKIFPNTWSFEASISLAAFTTGCYKIKILAGSGPDAKTLISDWQYISEDPLENTILHEYSNRRFHGDIMFESEIVFQYRVHGNFGFLEPGRKDEQYRDERYNPSILNSKTFRQYPLNYGDEFGLPDDHIDLINRIWSCDSVSLDDKPFAISDGGKLEFTEIDGHYPKRGVKLTVEEGVNRHSKILSVNTDTSKKLMFAILVDKKAFGDTGNQGSANTVPVTYVE